MEKIKTMNFYIHGLCFLSQSSPLCDRIFQLNFTANHSYGQEKEAQNLRRCIKILEKIDDFAKNNKI